eukprot:Rmarinus@m.11608
MGAGESKEKSPVPPRPSDTHHEEEDRIITIRDSAARSSQDPMVSVIAELPNFHPILPESVESGWKQLFGFGEKTEPATPKVEITAAPLETLTRSMQEWHRGSVTIFIHRQKEILRQMAQVEDQTARVLYSFSLMVNEMKMVAPRVREVLVLRTVVRATATNMRRLLSSMEKLRIHLGLETDDDSKAGDSDPDFASLRERITRLRPLSVPFSPSITPTSPALPLTPQQTPQPRRLPAERAHVPRSTSDGHLSRSSSSGSLPSSLQRPALASSLSHRSHALPGNSAASASAPSGRGAHGVSGASLAESPALASLALSPRSPISEHPKERRRRLWSGSASSHRRSAHASVAGPRSSTGRSGVRTGAGQAGQVGQAGQDGQAGQAGQGVEDSSSKRKAQAVHRLVGADQPDTLNRTEPPPLPGKGVSSRCPVKSQETLTLTPPPSDQQRTLVEAK